jgi:hypothetical protein
MVWEVDTANVIFRIDQGLFLRRIVTKPPDGGFAFAIFNFPHE